MKQVARLLLTFLGLAPRMLLVSNWSDGIPTAFDITVTSPLTPVSLQEASVTPGTAALLAERRKHQANDPKCHMLGWKCTPSRGREIWELG